MPFSAADSKFPRQASVTSQAGTTDTHYRCLSVADPNVAAIPPVARTLGIGSDSSLWLSDGTTWTNIGSGGGGTISNPMPDNTVFGFGNSSDGQISYVSASDLFKLTTVAASAGIDSANVLLSTGTATGAGTSGDVGITSGTADQVTGSVGITTGTSAPGINTGLIAIASGAATGMLIDNATGLVQSRLPAPTPEMVRQAIAEGARIYASRGWVGICNMSTSLGESAIFEDLERAGALPLRADIYLTPEDSSAVLQRGPYGEGLVHVRGVGPAVMLPPITGFEPTSPQLAARLVELHGAGEAMFPGKADTDIYLDAAGVPAVIGSAVTMAKRGATIGVVAVHKAPVPVDFLSLMSNEITILGSMGYPDEIFDVTSDLVANWQKYARIVSHTIPFDQVNEALVTASTPGAADKIVVTFD